MQFVIKGKNLQLTDALKDYAEKKLTVIKKYFDHIVEVDVTLSVKDSKDTSRSRVCEVTVWAKSIGNPIHGKSASEDLYASIDMVVEKIERQVKKFKEKITGRRRNNKGADKQATHSVLSFGEDFANRTDEAASEELKPKIVRSGTFPLRPMFSDEAAEQLELFNQDFFVFSNAETNRINVIYRRGDGNFGLIEPEY
ncbi:MAG TPA: ribosome-associated translation inhibitor RaiA [Candidatus Rifleibacterium sp.]|nr:ribosome-associated translation inhibitor RaiA [Candidatus Rifleibacterium sp.]HPT44484.1 ribosome-associated translation inhibitor RaiA [Candidatus Rifleibacterium sp.]